MENFVMLDEPFAPGRYHLELQSPVEWLAEWGVELPGPPATFRNQTDVAVVLTDQGFGRHQVTVAYHPGGLRKLSFNDGRPKRWFRVNIDVAESIRGCVFVAGLEHLEDPK